MAADYSQIGLDKNLYTASASGSLANMSPADLEVLFPDGELPGSKVGTVGAAQLMSGQLAPGEAITATDGDDIRILIGYQREGF